MTNDERHEDQLIEDALAGLEGGLPADGEPRAAGARGGEAETLARLYTEVLGLMAYDAPTAAPPPALRDRVLALVRGDETQEVEPGSARAAELRGPAPFPTAAALLEKPAAPAFGQPVERSAARPPVRPAAPAAAYARPARRWPLALAAGLALALLGIASWLALGLAQQSATIDRLQAELRRERERIAELERARDTERASLALVTSPAVEVAPLRPVPGEPAAPAQARGVLYVAADHQHWFLSVQGLPPAGPERDYQLWFIAAGRPVSAGTFDPAAGAPSTLSSATMPAGTELAAITVEPAGGAPQPTGPMVLRSGAPLKIL